MGLTRNEKLYLDKLSTIKERVDSKSLTALYDANFSDEEKASINNVLRAHLTEFRTNTNWMRSSKDGVMWLINDINPSFPSGRGYSYYDTTDVSKAALKKMKTVQKDVIEKIKTKFKNDLNIELDIRVVLHSQYDYSIRDSTYTGIGLGVKGERFPTLDELAKKKQEARSWATRLKQEIKDNTETLNKLLEIVADE